MATERDRRREAYVEKARAELSGLAARGVRMGGNAFSAVVLAKGDLSPEEQAGAELLSGPDGVALRKSLAKLGYEPEDWCTICLPEPGSPGALPAPLVREALAALDAVHMDAAIFGDTLHVITDDAVSGVQRIRAALEGAGIRVGRTEKIVPSLEDVFAELTR